MATTPEFIRSSLVQMDQLADVYARLGNLYNGVYKETFSSTREEQEFSQAAKNWRLNVARRVVDAIVECCKINGPICADNQDKARDLLVQYFDDNKLKFESVDTHEKAFIYGQAFRILEPDDTLPSGMASYVHSPESVQVFYRADKPRVKSHAIHRFDAFGTEEDGLDPRVVWHHVTVYFPDRVERWVSNQPVGDGQYRYVDSSTVDLHMWDSFPSVVPGKIPVFDYDLRRSRLADVFGPQVMIHDTLICMMATIRAAGFRQRWVSAEMLEQLRDNFSRKGAISLNTDSGHSQFEQGPDNVHVFTGKDVKIGSWDVSSAENFIKAINALLFWLGQIADLPTSDFRESADAMSGEAFRQSRMALNKAAQTGQERFADVWTEEMDYYLEFKGIRDAEPSVSWASQQIVDKDFLEMQLQKRDLGIPDKVLILELGDYTQEDLDEWAKDEEPTPEPAPQIAESTATFTLPTDDSTDGVE